jgi:hypothetical protein
MAAGGCRTRSGITERSDSAAIVAGRGRGFGTAVTGETAGAGHPGPTLSAVTCLASTTGHVAL